MMAKYYADITGVDLSQVLIAFGVILGGFYAFATKQMRNGRSEREKERKDFSSLMTRFIKSIDANTSYLKERNGRDNEVHTALMKQMQKLPEVFYSTEVQRTKEFKAIMEALPKIDIKKQTISEQEVQHQEVKKAILKSAIIKDKA